MPARSQAQRGLIYSKFGPAFAKKHHFDNPGKLPDRVPKRKRGSKASRAHKSAHQRGEELAKIVREAR